MRRKASVGGDGWQPKKRSQWERETLGQKVRGQLVKRPGQRPFCNRVRWVHGFPAEYQADGRYLGGLTDGSEGQDVDDRGPEG